MGHSSPVAQFHSSGNSENEVEGAASVWSVVGLVAERKKRVARLTVSQSFSEVAYLTWTHILLSRPVT